MSKQEFFCRADALKAAEKIQKGSPVFLKPEMQIVEIPKYRRGRPKKDGSRTLEKMMYGVNTNIVEAKAVEELKKGNWLLFTFKQCSDQWPKGVQLLQYSANL